jgi:hypothetical protein
MEMRYTCGSQRFSVTTTTWLFAHTPAGPTSSPTPMQLCSSS